MSTFNCEIINQYSKTYTEPYKKKRTSCRGLIVENGKILLSHEMNTGVYMSPGGGIEAGETKEDCCVREVREETGFEVKPLKHFLTVNEYCYDTLYIAHYFLCEVTGQGKQALTETEIDHGIVPEWVEIPDALEIFGEYKKKTPDHESLYRREFTVINKYLESKKQ